MPIENDKNFFEVVSYFPPRLQKYFQKIDEKIRKQITEIRLRIGKPIVLEKNGECCFLNENGMLTYIYSSRFIQPMETEISEIVNKACGYSLYSHQDELVNGFITLPGGHRMGICGTASTEQGCVSAIRNICGVNIRIAREILDSSTDILQKVSENFPQNILLAGPPLSGKTTILRDMIRQCSNGYFGKYFKCVVIDERNEIAPCKTEQSIGVNTDILTAFPKAEGIMLSIRTLSPNIIFCDEIGSQKDVSAILNGISCGVSFVATVHAKNFTDLKNRTGIQSLLRENIFDSIIFLGTGRQIGKIQSILHPKEEEKYEIDWTTSSICSVGNTRTNICTKSDKTREGIILNH